MWMWILFMDRCYPGYTGHTGQINWVCGSCTMSILIHNAEFYYDGVIAGGKCCINNTYDLNIYTDLC